MVSTVKMMHSFLEHYKFQIALDQANIVNDVRVYDGVGHAFWKDMEQIERGKQPQTDAYEQCISFLREYFG